MAPCFTPSLLYNPRPRCFRRGLKLVGVKASTHSGTNVSPTRLDSVTRPAVAPTYSHCWTFFRANLMSPAAMKLDFPIQAFPHHDVPNPFPTHVALGSLNFVHVRRIVLSPSAHSVHFNASLVPLNCVCRRCLARRVIFWHGNRPIPFREHRLPRPAWKGDCKPARLASLSAPRLQDPPTRRW